MRNTETSRGWFLYQHERGSGWVVRYRYASGKWRDHRVPPVDRGGPRIPPTLDKDPSATEEQKAAALAKARRVVDDYAKRLLARRAQLLRREGIPDHAELVGLGAASTSAAPEKRATTPKPPSPTATDDEITVEKLAELWTSGELLRRHGRVNRLRAKKSVYTDRVRLQMLGDVRTRGKDGPRFGELLVREVTDEDVEAVMASVATLKRKRERIELRSGTVVQFFALLHRLFDLAEFPCRLRPKSSNPVDRRLRPPRDPDKIFSFLLPNELVTLLRARSVPAGRKVLYVLGCYAGLRKANLLSLRWRDVDLENGLIAVTSTKTGLPLYFEIHFESVRRLLTAWREVRKPATGAELVVPDIACAPEHTALVLREDLQAAGVTRSILFADDPAIEKLRFHDLRATFVTWAKRAGKGDGWIADRTGHLTTQMIERYTRAARSIEAARFVPFPDLTPELDNVLTSSTAG